MKNAFILAIGLLLMSTTCKKKDCHHIIYFHNQSEFDVVFGLLYYNINNDCKIIGETVRKGSIFEFRPYRSCIENNLVSDSPLEVYLINAQNYNEGDFYDCDSVSIKNEILRKYVFFLNDLQDLNFTVIYL